MDFDISIRLIAFSSVVGLMAIWGKEDCTLHAKNFLPLFRSAFPNGLIHEIDNARHYSPADQPSLVAHLIDNFMRGSVG